jgi:molybdopterin-guanine dinucleotide biosynthesis protein A
VYGQVSRHFDEVLIAANDTEKYGFLGVPIVPDRIQGQGPLMGIASSVEASRHDLNFVTACDCLSIDIPFVHTMLRRAADCDCVVPVNADGYFEPLCAVYRKSALHAMWRTLHEGERRIRVVFPRCRTVYVPLPAETPLENINTPEDFARLEQRDEFGGSITLLEPSRSGTRPR